MRIHRDCIESVNIEEKNPVNATVPPRPNARNADTALGIANRNPTNPRKKPNSTAETRFKRVFITTYSVLAILRNQDLTPP